MNIKICWGWSDRINFYEICNPQKTQSILFVWYNVLCKNCKRLTRFDLRNFIKYLRYLGFKHKKLEFTIHNQMV